MLATILALTKSRSSSSDEAPRERQPKDYREEMCLEIGRACQEKVFEFDANTALSGNTTISTIPDDVVTVGKLLGKGGFSAVHHVTVQQQAGEEPRSYACKHLRKNVMKERHEFAGAAVDLVTEAKILNAIQHPNIISLLASSCGTLERAYLKGACYCIFVDRLYGTVEEKFDEWRLQQAHYKNKRDLQSRLQHIALPMAKAMAYLHSNRIIFRDIKPANMGYAEDRTAVKLFDFGLARELPATPSSKKLTGCTGSRRFMAPEVALSLHYGFPADVYSFGIFLYECCSLQSPFEGLNRAEHMDQVVKGRHRPKLSGISGSNSLQKLIAKCWQRNPRYRPTFDQIIQALQAKLDGAKTSNMAIRGFVRHRWSSASVRSSTSASAA